MHKDPAFPADALRDFPCAGSGRQGEHAAGQGLAAAKNIRRDSGPFSGEKSAGAAEARGDLVKNQQHAGLTAEVRQSSQIVRVVKPHTARALHHGLQNHGRNFFAVPFQLTAGVVQTGRIKRRVKTAGRPFHEDLLRQQARKQAVHARNRVTDRHGPQSVAVITAARCQETRTPSLSPALLILKGHLQGHFHCHGTGIGKKNTLQALGHAAQQAFGQIHRRNMRQPAEHHVRHASGLGPQRRQQPGMIVAMRRRPPGGHAVDQFPPIGQDNAIAVAAPNRAKGRQMHGRGIGMPDSAVVAFHQIRSLRTAPLLRQTAQLFRQRGQARGQDLPTRAVQSFQTGQFQHGRAATGLSQPRAQNLGIVSQNTGFVVIRRIRGSGTRGNQGQGT